MNELQTTRSQSWRWAVCILLLFATMLLYMDRQTLSQMASRISEELKLTNEEIGLLEFSFGVAFACGMLLFGSIADRWSVRLLYPIALLGWSAAGVATGYAPEIGEWISGVIPDSLKINSGELTWLGRLAERPVFLGFAVCRLVLGFFESGQWPCALITTQRLLAAKDRPLGNSILQSGASLGAILTPIVVLLMMDDQPGAWRGPFKLIGILGIFWVVPWLLMIQGSDLVRRDDPDSGEQEPADLLTLIRQPVFLTRFLALLVVVVAINLTWQYFRAWLPKMLHDTYAYSDKFIYGLTIAYYVSADLGCLGAGAAAKWLVKRGMALHTARMTVFGTCCGITVIGLLIPALPRSAILVAIILFVGFGALGLFPNYYSFAQELSSRSQGKIGATLGATTWVVTSIMQWTLGKSIDETKSYAMGVRIASFVPLLGLVAMLILWNIAVNRRVGNDARSCTPGR